MKTPTKLKKVAALVTLSTVHGSWPAVWFGLTVA
jgi:hypothetical protein